MASTQETTAVISEDSKTISPAYWSRKGAWVGMHFLESEQTLTCCWCRSTELLPQDTSGAAVATQTRPLQRPNLPEPVPDVTRCGGTPAAVILEGVSPQAVPRQRGVELSTAAPEASLSGGPHPRTAEEEIYEEAAQWRQNTHCPTGFGGQTHWWEEFSGLGFPSSALAFPISALARSSGKRGGATYRALPVTKWRPGSACPRPVTEVPAAPGTRQGREVCMAGEERHPWQKPSLLRAAAPTAARWTG